MMQKKPFLTFLLVTLLSLGTISAQSIELPKVSMKDHYSDRAIPVDQNRVLLKNSLLRKIDFVSNKVLYTLLNQSNEVRKPKFELIFFNSYGMELGREKIIWMFDDLKPGERAEESDRLNPPNLREILKHSAFRLPDDLEKISWVVVLGS